ncbi:MAG TPA: porin [Noviherbaspirillum sp.]|uniref:porin n=1 Tax=Noviherbaspirillum sp. TaxID=1926288 RepID=UPI002B4706AC|nr:porin [Noviherbaspirillum sp.]HJV84843.1 porin [Noviherbaspirillum sp.]
MKKSLLALAVLGAFAGAAQAQSAVTIYGSFDGGVRNLTNVNAAGDNRLTMGSNGTYNSNRIGFKGAEDLGGGLNAHFVLETGFNTGTGTLDNAANRLFNRSAFVGLGGAWGSVDLGRQYSVNFKTIGLYDPFNYKYTAIVPLAAQGGLTRLDNDVQYNGKFGPVGVSAEYALGEVAGSTSNGATEAIGANYAGGPVTVGAAYTKRKNLVGTTYMDFDNWTVGGAYATGPFRVAVGYAKAKQDTSATTETNVKDAWLGGSYNVTPAAQLSLAYYRTTTDTATTTGRRNLVILGGTYAMSKRTNFYADIDNSKLSGTAVTVGQTRQTGISVGINHLF